MKKNVILRTITLLAAMLVIYGLMAIESASNMLIPILLVIIGMSWLILFFSVNDSYLIKHHELW